MRKLFILLSLVSFSVSAQSISDVKSAYNNSVTAQVVDSTLTDAYQKACSTAVTVIQMSDDILEATKAGEELLNKDIDTNTTPAKQAVDRAVNKACSFVASLLWVGSAKIAELSTGESISTKAREAVRNN